ncbi:c-type cytochrome [Pontibacter anaerobius]|uniref:C-type cytochrome n=1 Tax=Pontibacter anaerobius TaxID=2993940 RepID=A0ABT3REG5_9BACT|nr:c-type cytochrome [Pontibacter anaerobius]MCX2740014.1 c-type cytochrome [Pontibacter anaerobius]
MKKALKVVGYVVVFALVALAAVVIYLQYALPNVDAAPNLTVKKTSEQIERGRYLANHVTVCIDCHSTRDFSRLSAPPVPGTFGKGGDKFDHNMGFPGTFYARNITPDRETGIGTWTDGEVYRAMTKGVSKDGEPLFPMMPYGAYSQLTNEDAHAIIAYIRTLDPIKNEVPKSEPDFPFNLILRTMPSNQIHPATDKAVLDNELSRGKYLVTIAGCGDCHSPKEEELGKFSGGMDFKFPDGAILRAANITPDNETGIGSWTEEAFLLRFKMYQDTDFANKQLAPGQMQTLMPWKMYSGMKEEDLRAIYKYLRTQHPVKNKVERYTPPATS